MKIKRMLMSFAVLGLGLVSLTSCGDKPNEIEIVNEDGTTEKVSVEATKDQAKVAKALNAVAQKEAEKEVSSIEVALKGNVEYAYSSTVSYGDQTITSSTSLSAKANAVVKVEIDKENPLNSLASAKGSAELNMTVKAASDSITMKYKASGNAYLDGAYGYADYSVETNAMGQTSTDSGKYKVTYEQLYSKIQEVIEQITSGQFPGADTPSIDLPSNVMTVEEAVEAYGITITGTSADTITFGLVLDENALGQDLDGNADTNLELITVSLTWNTVYMVPSQVKVDAGDVLKYVELPTSDNPLDKLGEVKVTKSSLNFEYSMKFNSKVDKLTDAQKAEYTETTLNA